MILDCAHNEMSIAALLETLALELGPGVRPRLVFGCLADKQFERMAAMLAPRIKDVVVTRVSGLDLGPNVRKRPADVEDLARQFAPHVPVRVERDPLRAIDLAIASAAPEDVVLATGSVYLIGEIYPYFLAREGRGGLFPEAAP